MRLTFDWIFTVGVSERESLLITWPGLNSLPPNWRPSAAVPERSFLAAPAPDAVDHWRALSKRFGQPVVAEPRRGAGGNTASQRLATSPPDGYTLITLTGCHSVSAAMYKQLPFDPV